MKLYVTLSSPYARMARIVVLEKGLERRVALVEAKTRTASSPYYAINPSGRVPYLVRDDGVGMEESLLICDYLDRIDGRPALSVPPNSLVACAKSSRTRCAKRSTATGGASTISTMNSSPPMRAA